MHVNRSTSERARQVLNPMLESLNSRRWHKHGNQKSDVHEYAENYYMCPRAPPAWRNTDSRKSVPVHTRSRKHQWDYKRTTDTTGNEKSERTSLDSLLYVSARSLGRPRGAGQGHAMQGFRDLGSTGWIAGGTYVLARSLGKSNEPYTVVRTCLLLVKKMGNLCKE